MIAQTNEAIEIAQVPTTVDLHALFWCPYESRVSPDVEHARRHTLAWLTKAGIITGPAQRGYVDAMRLDLYATRVAPMLNGPALNLFCDWIVFTPQLDDHLSTDDPATIHDLVYDLTAVLDHDDPHRVPPGPDPFLPAFADLWERCQHIAQPWRRQLADLWGPMARGLPH